jgi:acetyl esterase/lipase
VIYGGGFVSGSKSSVSNARLESLTLDLGFVVVVPNYRHCPTVSLYEGPIRDVHDCYLWTHDALPKILLDDLGIVADGQRIAVIGSSAGGLLALHLVGFVNQPPHRASDQGQLAYTNIRPCYQGSATPPPKAIAAYFPALYLSDAFWSTPMASMSAIPRFQPEFLDQVMEEGTVVEAPPSFKKIPESPVPVPDLARPRAAWFLSHLRDGTWMQNIVQDGDYARVDPAELFSERYPPTCFIHGTEDKVIPPRFSEQAYRTLQSFSVQSELLIVEGKGHDFENGVGVNEPLFATIQRSHLFLAEWI